MPLVELWRGRVAPACRAKFRAIDDASMQPLRGFPPTVKFIMPTVPVLGPAGLDPGESAARNPLPTLLQTPSGLALLEIQGTIHVPPAMHDENGDVDMNDTEHGPISTPVGSLVFPLYDPGASQDDTRWMKKVYLYVGNNQRLSGQVQKLPKVIAVLKRDKPGENRLRIMEIVKHKILFSSRPEPVGQEEG
jgi:chromosome transmission fidelity protein 8